MKEVQSYLTRNECYQRGTRLTAVHGVMVHSTACPGAKVEAFTSSWNVPQPNGYKVCVHAFIDDETMANTLPYNIRSWGCGGSGNDVYIQIEMCEFRNRGKNESEQDYALARQVYMDKLIKGLVKFIVDRLQENEIDVVNAQTVTSHYEGYQRGIASNHADPRPFLGLVGLTMNDIRSLCENELKARKSHAQGGQVDNANPPQVIGDTTNCPFTVKLTSDVTPIYEEPSPTSKKVRDIVGFGVYTITAVQGNYGFLKSKLGWIKITDDDDCEVKPYLVKITMNVVNIRSDPGTAHQIVGTITDNGVYTIIEQIGNWGRLKSKIGWIDLNGVTKLRDA